MLFTTFPGRGKTMRATTRTHTCRTSIFPNPLWSMRVNTHHKVALRSDLQSRSRPFLLHRRNGVNEEAEKTGINIRASSCSETTPSLSVDGVAPLSLSIRPSLSRSLPVAPNFILWPFSSSSFSPRHLLNGGSVVQPPETATIPFSLPCTRESERGGFSNFIVAARASVRPSARGHFILLFLRELHVRETSPSSAHPLVHLRLRLYPLTGEDRKKRLGLLQGKRKFSYILP